MLFIVNCLMSTFQNMISQRNSKTVDIRQVNVNNFLSVAYQDKMDGGHRLETIMSGIAKKTWDSGMPIIILLDYISYYNT